MMCQNEMKILSSFFPRVDSLTSKEIEEKSEFSHETTFRLLKDLVQKGYLREKKVGKTNVYELIRDRDVLYQVYVDYVMKKRIEFKKKYVLLYKRLYEFLNEVNPEGPAVLFGSFAKGTETKKSDIDVLCITNKKNVQRIADVFKTKYNMNIQLVVVTTAEFKHIKKDNPPFWDDLLEYGIVLDGLDLLFKEAYLND